MNLDTQELYRGIAAAWIKKAGVMDSIWNGGKQLGNAITHPGQALDGAKQWGKSLVGSGVSSAMNMVKDDPQVQNTIKDIGGQAIKSSISNVYSQYKPWIIGGGLGLAALGGGLLGNMFSGGGQQQQAPINVNVNTGPSQQAPRNFAFNKPELTG